MAGWFSRIIKRNEPVEAEPVEFVLTCRCGEPVTGVRHRRMQVAVCPACAHQLCVLPVSPYPRPKVRAPKKKPATPPLPKRHNAVVSDDEEESPRKPPPLPKRGDQSVEAPARKLGAKKPVKGVDKKAAPQEEPLWKPPRRKLITPLRLIAVGMLAVVSLAGWWVAHQRALSQAVVVYAEASKAGRTALAKSDFVTADQQYRRAVASLDLLKREDREARLVRQLAREAAAAKGLAMIGLFDLVTEAKQTQNMAGSDWQKVLKNSYQGDWFLLETNALQFPSSDRVDWTFTLPLVPGIEPIQVRGDLSKWSKNLDYIKKPPQFVLAGQLADIRWVGGGGKGWEIVLDSDSICLWTDATTYTTLNGTLDADTAATLKSQATMLGVAE